ncbi:outer membrane transport energization protein TonB [Pacificibacter maritimus]|uniref:Outer membrane transport energization protein TonB n=1 Tax=Pacificibacter maritimus TaxID=762213 RepID=A0A3N4V0H1_9RHOB|nr:TonB family protein [Pacificibacter maritimus]RPE67340.1 outer membrane transport energization protein TonB [Pacificibacter maritimus]
MSFAYAQGNSGPLIWTLALVGSVAVHGTLSAQFIQDPTPPITASAGATGAILFDLADVITAPSTSGEASVEVAEAEDAPTVTESPEVVEAAKAADEPMLAQIPYAVEDDSLKFGIASPDPVEDTEETAEEMAQAYDEEKILEPSAVGSEAAEAQAASSEGSDAADKGDTAQAKSEGLTAVEMAQIADWQKSIVVRIAAARKYPAQARSKKIEGEVRMRFSIDQYGVIISRSVETTSGAAILDQAALDVLDGIEKLPTPPQSLAREAITMIVPINYRFK